MPVIVAAGTSNDDDGNSTIVTIVAAITNPINATADNIFSFIFSPPYFSHKSAILAISKKLTKIAAS